MGAKTQPQGKSFWQEVAKSVIASIIVGVIVGMSAAYLTVQEVSQRAQANTDRIIKIEDRQDAAKASRSRDSERLIRVETKVDLLLEGKSLKDGR